MLQRNFLDRLIGVFSPAAELRRLKARAGVDFACRHYEGGSKSRRTETWKTTNAGPTAASDVTLSTLRNRSRDLVRNNPWARTAIEDIDLETVGTGIRLKLRTRAGAAAAELTTLWKAWAETTACDADGNHDFYGLQGLALRTIAESGEVLIRRRARRLSDGLPLPVQLQVLEPDHLDSSRDALDTNTGHRIQGGIEFDALGRRVAYWLFPEHPGENFGFIPGQSSVRVPADSVRHVYRIERPGQIRGIPWGATAVIRLRDFDVLEDARLQREQIAACFAVFIEGEDTGSPAALAGVDLETDDGLSGIKKPPVERIYPGMIERLEPGKKISFASPPGTEGHDSYSRTVLRGIAAGFGTTYEALSGDYSDVNYSSGRLGWIRQYRRVEAWRWRILVPRLCQPVLEWVLNYAGALGYDTEGVQATWTPPGRDMLDPTKEVPATRAEIRAGLKSWSSALRERGEDPEEVRDELVKDRDWLDKNGLIVESDARRPSNGQPGDPALAQNGGAADPDETGDPPADDDEEADAEADARPSDRDRARRARVARRR